MRNQIIEHPALIMLQAAKRAHCSPAGETMSGKSTPIRPETAIPTAVIAAANSGRM
jgi:hypothetical protein